MERQLAEILINLTRLGSEGNRENKRFLERRCERNPPPWDYKIEKINTSLLSKLISSREFLLFRLEFLLLTIYNEISHHPTHFAISAEVVLLSLSVIFCHFFYLKDEVIANKYFRGSVVKLVSSLGEIAPLVLRSISFCDFRRPIGGRMWTIKFTSRNFYCSATFLGCCRYADIVVWAIHYDRKPSTSCFRWKRPF